MWQDTWFSNVALHKPGYWKQKDNQRVCLDAIAKKFNVVENKDWGKITNVDVINNGGSNVLKQYGGSLFRALQSIFSGILFVLYKVYRFRNGVATRMVYKHS